MDCKETTEGLEQFLSGKMGGEKSRRVRVHLAACAACRSLLKRLDRVEILTALDDAIEPSTDLEDRFKARMAAHRQMQAAYAAVPFLGRFSSWNWQRKWIALGALASLLAFGIYFGAVRRSMTSNEAAAAADLSIAENLPLLQDLGVIKNLDLLEDFDAIENLSKVNTRDATVQ